MSQCPHGEGLPSPDQLALDLEKVGFAEAEFYYDQTTPGQLQWADYKDDALWKLRWRARLRRFRLPVQVGLDQMGVALIGSANATSAITSLGAGWISGVTTAIAGSADSVVIH